MQPIHNIADASEDLRETALQRTADMLRKIDQIRKQLEMPVDQLPIVIEMYGKTVLALIAEEERKKMAEHIKRLPIVMRSENRDYQPMKILPAQKMDVLFRPQTIAFRPEEIAIHGDRSRWMVHDIKVGNRSQLGGHGPAPGTDFGPGGICEKLKLETCQTAMDFVLSVEYIGPEEAGEVFEATIVGLAV
jgi:hypothetical protein